VNHEALGGNIVKVYLFPDLVLSDLVVLSVGTLRQEPGRRVESSFGIRHTRERVVRIWPVDLDAHSHTQHGRQGEMPLYVRWLTHQFLFGVVVVNQTNLGPRETTTSLLSISFCALDENTSLDRNGRHINENNLAVHI